MSTTSGPGEEDLGTLERSDGQVRLIFTRRFPHPPGKVWRALTEAEHLAAWFPTTIEGDLVAGATLRFAFRDVESAGVRRHHADLRSTADCWSSSGATSSCGSS